MRRDLTLDPVVIPLCVLTVDPVVIPLCVLTLDLVVTLLLVLILDAAWPGAKPDAPGRPLMASLCLFRWPGAYAEAPFDTLFDTLPLLCITCPGAVGCWAMAGAPANAAKVPITARYLIIGLSFLCAPPITPAESQGFRPLSLPSVCRRLPRLRPDSFPPRSAEIVAIASFPLGFQSRAPNRQVGTN